MKLKMKQIKSENEKKKLKQKGLKYETNTYLYNFQQFKIIKEPSSELAAR